MSGTPPTRAESLAWAGDGAGHLRGLMMQMGDDAFAVPSALPGWTRAHVLTHIARNADALINLLIWARTGVETPAYASPTARDAAIEEGAKRAPAQIRADVLASSDRLAEAVRGMPKAAWAASVRNVQGQQVAAPAIAWMRAREVWIHAVDLDVGASFADFPAPMLAALLSDAAATIGAKPGCPGLRLVDGAASWSLGAVGDGSVEVIGPLPELAAWLLGRSAGKVLRADGQKRLPELPAWL